MFRHGLCGVETGDRNRSPLPGNIQVESAVPGEIFFRDFLAEKLKNEDYGDRVRSVGNEMSSLRVLLQFFPALHDRG